MFHLEKASRSELRAMFQKRLPFKAYGFRIYRLLSALDLNSSIAVRWFERRGDGSRYLGCVSPRPFKRSKRRDVCSLMRRWSCSS